MINVLEWVLLLSVATVALATLGYPLFLFLARPMIRRPRVQADIEPRVTLIIAAYNEEAVIADKIENALALDYPSDKLEIVVASDGSTDRTDDIVRSYSDRGIALQVYPRTGKTGVQNRVASIATGEILVFSDANAHYSTNAIRKLVRNFADPDVGGVCGHLAYRKGTSSAGASESLYLSYEEFMKQCESDLSSVVGANGSIYAIRKADYVPIDEGLISDFVEPLALVRNGRRVVFESEAVSMEDASSSFAGEFQRKVRILTRAILGLIIMRELLNPFRYRVFSIQLWLHKLLRFTIPVFLITGAAALTGLAAAGRFRELFLACAVGVLVAIIAGRGEASGQGNAIVRVANLAYYVLLVNCALVLAWINVFRGNRMKLWAPDRRQP